MFYKRKLVLAPDGSEAFDDGSFVLQFDAQNDVRLIGFKTNKEGYGHEPNTLSDIWVGADEFYRILEDWSNAFEKEWCATAKTA